MEPFNWTCPHCERDVTISESMYSEDVHKTYLKDDIFLRLTSIFIKCPNPKCLKATLIAILDDCKINLHGNPYDEHQLNRWDLVPESKAKHFPDYVPAPIIEDYTEACLIKDLSPKASATLSRRCLQGMIRDFWNVKEKTLFLEIKAIEEKIDPETHAAIDAVRSIGNIGAHMEKDIDLILEVEPREAELLIHLIETLINDWYVAREVKRNRMAAIVSAATEKKEVKAAQ